VAFKDHFSAQAGQYTRFRPRYPHQLLEFLAESVPVRHRAWDCGTGNGQAALALAEFFDQVVATDPSPQQIAHASPHPKVTYLVSTAEQCPLPTATVDLVGVAQALHWFDLERFYAEVRRVARAGGTLAVWSYGLATITTEVDDVVAYLYEDVLGHYWPPERKVVEKGYATIPFPFVELAVPGLTMTAHWDLRDFVGYLGTWSSTQRFIARHGRDPVDELLPKLKEAWGGDNKVREIHWPLNVRAGRVE
jgi:SAM-dependent methyltransferase